MKRNPDSIEAGLGDKVDVFARDVSVAILMPELCRTRWANQFVDHSLDLARRLRPSFEAKHIALGHQPIAQVCPAQDQLMPRRIGQKLAIRMHKASLRGKPAG